MNHPEDLRFPTTEAQRSPGLPLQVRAVPGAAAATAGDDAGPGRHQNIEASAPVATPAQDKPRLLLELRPALEGFAGIPQETRLLFRGLRMIESYEIEGMIQASMRRLSRGASKKKRGLFGGWTTEARRIDRYSRVVVSLADQPFRTILDRAAEFLDRRLQASMLTVGVVLGMTKVRLTEFRSQYFEDFIWRTLFSKTLPASDYDLITGANQRICSVPWNTMHRVGLKSLSLLPSAKYLQVDTREFDIFIAQTPFPGRVSRKTSMIVRYHDAIPVFMPHTIPDKAEHQATHFHALSDNVRSGAWFACVSEATRRDLLRLFPEAESRSVTIHNMVSHHYFPEDSEPALIPGVIRSRLYEGDPGKQKFFKPKFLSLREQEGFYQRHLHAKPLRYLLMVSTIEPRKNHSRLLAAWEVLKAEIDPDIKLVVVGALGWDYNAVFESFRAWIDRGELFPLSAVPAPDLRVLYRHAAATICPSLGEGFDFSGVESMRSGGLVIASDIPVHREVYEDASEYFDPYSTASLVKALRKLLYSDEAPTLREQLKARGQVVSSRYLPERILPRWREFLARVSESKRVGRVIDAPPSRLEREVVIAAFRDLLGREPESEETIDAHRDFGSAADLRLAIKSSAEFDQRLERVRQAQLLADEAIRNAIAVEAVRPGVGPGSDNRSPPPPGESDLARMPVRHEEPPVLAGASSGEPIDFGSASGQAAETGAETLVLDVVSVDAGVPASRGEVIRAFRELLGRDPESETTIRNHLAHGSIDAVRSVIETSMEFRARQTTSPGASRWVCTEVLDGARIWVDLNDRFVSQGCLQGAWEPEETAFFRTCVAGAKVVLDIGANVGWYSIVAARAMASGGLVHAFEPRPETARMLRRSMAESGLEDRVRVWDCALGDRNGTQVLAWEPASGNPGHSYLIGSQGLGPASEAVGEVRVATLDSTLPEVVADVIKIDVEGAEPLVFAGARRLIARHRPVILSELFPDQLRDISSSSCSLYISMMEGLGYRCYLLEGGRPGRRLTDFPSDATRELVSVVFDPSN